MLTRPVGTWGSSRQSCLPLSLPAPLTSYDPSIDPRAAASALTSIDMLICEGRTLLFQTSDPEAEGARARALGLRTVRREECGHREALEWLPLGTKLVRAGFWTTGLLVFHARGCDPLAGARLSP